MFLYLFLSIFPCFIGEIKFIVLAFEEEEENREAKEWAVNGTLLMKTGNMGGRKGLGN